jgi:hypothetical protein
MHNASQSASSIVTIKFRGALKCDEQGVKAPKGEKRSNRIAYYIL